MNVWEHELYRYGMNEISLPAGAEPLCVRVRNNIPYIYTEVNPNVSEYENRVIWFHATGDQIPDDAVWIDTIEVDQMTWHIYEYQN